ncbi:MAG TPA: hypothetical protein VGS19_26015 [Streptosporangiaceae bacterium]|nr:hypothetical protein [Streptosporangiaceae bacterium]
MPQDQAPRSAVVAPGRFYSIDGPLLMYARLAVERRGGHTHPIVWDLPDTVGFGEEHGQVASQVVSAIDAVITATGVTPLVIAKSTGTLAASVVADRGLAAVWLTPLLTDEPTVAAMRRATGPCLLAGGTGDGFWDGRTARSITPHVVEVEGADHGMFIPGRLAASAMALATVITAVEDFLDHIAWA